MIGTVKGVKILKPSRDRRTGRVSGLNGLVIEFETETNVKDGSVIEMLGEKSSTFRVKEVEVSGDKLIARAEEYGYWARKLDRDKELDLRTLVGNDIELITNEERLSQLRTESLWC